MRKRVLFILVAAAAGIGIAACGGTTEKKYSGKVPTNRAALIRAFPSNVRSLLTSDIPTPVIAALLKVRKSGPSTLVDWDSGGQLYQGEVQAYIRNWERITGWNVKDIAPVITPGQLRAKVASGNPGFDFFETGSNGNALLEQQQGLMQPLDMHLLRDDLAMFPKGEGFKWTNYWIQYGYFGALLMWNKRKWPMSGPHPTTPLDLFNLKKFPGKRCLYNYPEFAGTLEYPLLAAGVSPHHMYPLNVNLAFKKLDTIKKDVVWWSSGAQPVNDIVNGNCAMGVDWNGRPALAIKANPTLPIGVSWKGIILVTSGWAIPKGAPNAQAANSLIAYDFTPLNQCRFLNTLGYGVPMRSSCINAFGRKWAVTAQHIHEAALFEDDAYYNKVITQLTNRFNAWLTS